MTISVYFPMLYIGLTGITAQLLIRLFTKYGDKQVSDEAWFPLNKSKYAYLAIKEQPEAPLHHVKAALLARAVECVRRIRHLQSNEQVLPQLMQKGLINDRLHHELKTAETEAAQEGQEIFDEAEALVRGWSKTIFTTAMHMIEFEKLKQSVDTIRVPPQRE
ncbi:hypothetical protein DM01DRAFT_1411423 [Hesseltinella vesiculosa]|uniref:Translocation protein sec66 n=1 Tax=Hesseltinella vesiculosa TaxID=101127 RepID=A0A1X2G3W1_9FUNG|nr:hypothetical protein DM01DRAFT_1411423 [Hesseltinella vesiculosa]